MRALIVQHSGEDWSGVKLVLSTAAPHDVDGAARAVVDPHRPRAASAARSRGVPSPPQGAGALFADFDRDRQALLQPAACLPSPYSLPAMEAPADLESEMRRPHGGGAPGGSAGEAQGQQESVAGLRELGRRRVDGRHARRRGGGAERRGARGGDATRKRPCRLSPCRLLLPLRPGPWRPPPCRMAPMPQGIGPGGSPARAALAPVARGPSQAGLEMVVFTHLQLVLAGRCLQPQPAPAHGLAALLSGDAGALLRGGDVRRDDGGGRGGEPARAVAHLPLPGGTVDVRGVGGNFDFSYAADATVDVPSDGVFHSVAVGTRTRRGQRPLRDRAARGQPASTARRW